MTNRFASVIICAFLTAASTSGCCWKNWLCRCDQWGCAPVSFHDQLRCYDPCDSCGNFVQNGGGCDGSPGCASCETASMAGLSSNPSASGWSANGRPTQQQFAASQPRPSSAQSSGFDSAGRPIGPATHVAGMKVPPQYMLGEFTPGNSSTRVPSVAIPNPTQYAGATLTQGMETLPEYVVEQMPGQFIEPAADAINAPSARLAVAPKSPRPRF